MRRTLFRSARRRGRTRTVYTAIFGGYDTLKPTPLAEDEHLICFTDDPELQADGWEVRVVKPAHPHPRMSAKYYKLMSHEVLSEFDQTLWLDGSLIIDDREFAVEAFKMLACGDFAVFLHPDRTCIYAEAEASVPMLKYQTQAVRQQVDHYREQRHPKDWGLYAATVIARNNRAHIVEELNHRWWMENARWTYQDQLTLPVVLRQLGVRPVVFPHGLWANPWFHFGSHTRDD